MTKETLDEALRISSEMNRINAIQEVLRNSKNRLLAAIEVKKMDPTKTVVEECRVVNDAIIPSHIMEKFEQVLWDELHALEKEFREL